MKLDVMETRNLTDNEFRMLIMKSYNELHQRNTNIEWNINEVKMQEQEWTIKIY